MTRNRDRREFLQGAPLALAAGFAMLDAQRAGGQAAATGAGAGFKVFRAAALAGDAQTLEAAPGNNNLVTEERFTVVMTVEREKSAKEFEWHEGRDHVLQILDGETKYEVGGTPRDGRQTRPGEWLAPVSEGATTLLLKKGDMLTVPRGTPHKRMTAGTVTFLLISPQG